MAKYRRGRINEALAQELAIALQDAKDPRLACALISVTRAEVAPDLRNAKVYVSFMDEEEKEIMDALKRATPMLRKHLAQTLNLRLTPDLCFTRDRSIEHGSRIAGLLEQIRREREAAAAKESEEEENV